MGSRDLIAIRPFGLVSMNAHSWLLYLWERPGMMPGLDPGGICQLAPSLVVARTLRLAPSSLLKPTVASCHFLVGFSHSLRDLFVMIRFSFTDHAQILSL